jgi:hypothetical protein
MFKLQGITHIWQKMRPASVNMPLLMSMLSYLVLTPIDSIIYIQWINSLINYKWLSGAIVFPIIGALFFYVPMLWYKKKGLLTRESRDIHQKFLFILAIFDSSSSILASLTVPYINILIMIILGRLSLPLTMVFSYFMLKRRYFWNHYAGVALTLGGVFLTIVPFLTGKEEHEGSNPGAIIVYMISIIPGVLSYIYKEKFLKGKEGLNIWWMNSWISWWQFVIGLLTIPLLFIPISYTYLPPDTFGQYLKNGLACQFGGVNFYNNDNCRLALLWLFLYQIISTIANILMFLILRHGSSLIFLVLATLKTPITGFLGYILMSYNLIYTTDAQKVTIHPTDYVSLLLIIAGSVVYNLKSEYTAISKNLTEQLLSMDDRNNASNEPSVEISLPKIKN